MHGGTPKDNCRYDCLVFDMAALLKSSQICTLHLQPIINHERRFITFFSADSEPAKDAKAVIDAMLEKEPGYEFTVPGRLLCMLGHIVARQEHYQSGETAASDIKKVRRFKNVISYIEQNYR